MMRAVVCTMHMESTYMLSHSGVGSSILGTDNAPQQLLPRPFYSALLLLLWRLLLLCFYYCCCSRFPIFYFQTTPARDTIQSHCTTSSASSAATPATAAYTEFANAAAADFFPHYQCTAALTLLVLSKLSLELPSLSFARTHNSTLLLLNHIYIRNFKPTLYSSHEGKSDILGAL